MAILQNIGSVTKKGYRNFVRAREHQATLAVHAYLAQFDDVTLGRMGMRRDELKTGGSVNRFF